MSDVKIGARRDKWYTRDMNDYPSDYSETYSTDRIFRQEDAEQIMVTLKAIEDLSEHKLAMHHLLIELLRQLGT